MQTDTGYREALSPKRPQIEESGLADIFPYYAGFSFEWAKTVLLSQVSTVQHDRLPTVLDPWNGSGTTLLAARQCGLPAVGIDLNPVANIAARVRVGQARAVTVPPPAPHASMSMGLAEGDPLEYWFSQRTIQRIREWTNALSMLPGGDSAVPYLSIFRAVRCATKKFEGSNPTWVKKAKQSGDVSDVAPPDFDEAVMAEQGYLLSRLASSPIYEAPTAAIITSSSAALPIANATVDLVLTSPPYLTRIDYAVAYARELAVLQLDADRSLRAALTGTTLIRPPGMRSVTNLGPQARDLLTKVSQHNSKDSAGYYKKQIDQYLADLTNSFDELARVTRNSGSINMVVQDSFYKEIPVPLAEICIEEMRLRGWEIYGRKRFPVRRTLMTLNTSARIYSKQGVEESVLTFRSAP